MKYSIGLLKADIEDELTKLGLLIKEFSEHESKLDEKELPFYDRAAIGYFLHSFYNGCENIFISIARFFENDILPESCHSDILKRMKLEIEGYRPRVINQELYRLLDDFRSFRHKFRHSYSFELDWEKEVLVAKKLVKTNELFQKSIRDFISELKGFEEPSGHRT